MERVVVQLDCITTQSGPFACTRAALLPRLLPFLQVLLLLGVLFFQLLCLLLVPLFHLLFCSWIRPLFLHLLVFLFLLRGQLLVFLLLLRCQLVLLQLVFLVLFGISRVWSRTTSMG